MLDIAPEALARLESCHTIWIGFSGGLDSSVLLYHLAQQPQFKNRLTAVHVHHGLSSNSTIWQEHCQNFCLRLNVPIVVRKVYIASRGNIEETARLARYQAFANLIHSNDCLLLAHHADDQAETLLLQLFRGTGIDGLAAMPVCKPFVEGYIIRPFLHLPRASLQLYAARHQLTWVEDESNADDTYSRNYLRLHVMPLVKKKWPGVQANLVSCVRHCQQGLTNLNSLATIDYPDIALQGATLSLIPLQTLSQERIGNILRVWLRSNQVALPSARILDQCMTQVIAAKVDATPCVRWGKVVLKRYRHTLYLLSTHKNTPMEMHWHSFPASLSLQHDKTYLHAIAAPHGLYVPINSSVQIRFRQGGEVFRWHGQTKCLKKLFQQWGVPPWERALIPLIFVDNHFAAVVGYAVSDPVAVAHSGEIEPLRRFEILRSK